MAFYSEDSADLPSEIREYIRPPLWGMEMYKCLKSAKIVLNIHIDLAANEAANMRLFEVTGVGSFLLTDAKPNLAQFFEPGVEVETFHTTSEMMQKIRFYLDHPIERERISKSGQDHCLKMFSRQKYADLFEEIIMKALVNRSTFKKFIKRYCRIFLSSSNLERVPSF
jgi:spore maturation protein CgeB